MGKIKIKFSLHQTELHQYPYLHDDIAVCDSIFELEEVHEEDDDRCGDTDEYVDHEESEEGGGRVLEGLQRHVHERQYGEPKTRIINIKLLLGKQCTGEQCYFSSFLFIIFTPAEFGASKVHDLGYTFPFPSKHFPAMSFLLVINFLLFIIVMFFNIDISFNLRVTHKE